LQTNRKATCLRRNPMPIRARLVTPLLVLSLLLSSCAQPSPAAPAAPTPTASLPNPTPTSTQPAPLRLSFSPEVPQGLRTLLQDVPDLEVVSSSADLTLELNHDEIGDATWVYALAAPFATVTDEVTLPDLQSLWHGVANPGLPASTLVMSTETRTLLTSAWGAGNSLTVETQPESDLTERVWADETTWAILPFEQLNPRLKVIAVDGLTPLYKDLDLQRYPLAFHFSFNGSGTLHPRLNADLQGTSLTNRDESKMTTLLMTGVTALSRQIAMTMNEKGVLYPAEKINSLMRSADITHTSNEASFFADCPAPRATFQRFCSDPAYLQLLQETGVDVVELTGNHLVDYGADSLLESLALYQENGFKLYGGGENLQAASQPLLIEDHGNKLAFLGCNFVGPENDWASDSQPGSNPCSNDPNFEKVKELTAAGYNVIYSIQFIENCEVKPLSAQRTEFRKAAAAGAVMVLGSQAHCPQGFNLADGSFIHYGLGNLFFDQMMNPNRLEFLDWAVFYNGRLLGVELVTAKLYDFAQPALMTPAERQQLLNWAFEGSEWK